MVLVVVARVPAVIGFVFSVKYQQNQFLTTPQ
jgi:hypothetical protein